MGEQKNDRGYCYCGKTYRIYGCECMEPAKKKEVKVTPSTLTNTNSQKKREKR